MSDPLDDRYLEWLYTLVGRQAENVDHYDLLHHLLRFEFISMPEAPSDENRCADGIALRHEFRRSDQSVSPTAHWMTMGCSVLEMLVGLARHLSFEMDGEVGDWFWQLIDNAGLTRYNDSRYHQRAVDRVVERIVWRQYSFNGRGGIFPLRRPHVDQREVELWFQMESYMLEMS